MKKQFVLGKGYTHFAIEKSTNLILSGWDYKGYNHAELMEDKDYYFYVDLRDWFDEFNKKDCRIVRRSVLEKEMVIEDLKNWKK